MERDWQKYYFSSSIVFVVFLVFCAQLFFVGFSNGHYGWVSSQGLSIILCTNFDHYLVGAASEFIKEDGSLGYYYFNRYPLIFSVLMKNILRAFEGDLPLYVFISRQLMNLVYLLTAWASFLFINLLLKDRIKSLAVVLFAMSGYFVLKYKTMVHFDQPALLGMMFLLYSIGRYKLEGRTKYLYLIAALVSIFGRGYVSCFMLLTWFIVEVIFSIARDRSWRELLICWKWPSFRSLMIGGTLAASILVYNIAMESKITGEKWNQTSIVVSAQSRLGHNQKTLDTYNKDLAWDYFTKEQFFRFKKGLHPFSAMRLGELGTGNKIARYAYLSIEILAMLLMFIFGVMSLRKVKKLTATHWSIIVISIVTSTFWMFKMRVLTAFHEYTMMYYLGPNILIYALIFSQLRKKYLVNIGLMIALLAFVTSIFLERDFYSSRMERTNHVTYDFQHIREKIDGTKQVIGINVNNKYVKTNKHRYFFPHMPYLVSFMLHGHYVTDYNKNATYVISRDKKFNDKNLTPDNKEIFLFSLR